MRVTTPKMSIWFIISGKPWYESYTIGVSSGNTVFLK